MVATTGDYWKLQKLLQRPELLKPVEDAKTDGDCCDHDKLTIVSNQKIVASRNIGSIEYLPQW